MKRQFDGITSLGSMEKQDHTKEEINSSNSFSTWELKRFILGCVDFTLEARAGCNKSNIV